MRGNDWRRVLARVIVVGVCLCIQARGDFALGISAAAPVMVQTGAGTITVQDAAANAIASASRTTAIDGIIASVSDAAVMPGVGGEVAVTVTETAAGDAVVGGVVACIASVVCIGAVASVAAIAAALRVKSNGDGTVSVDPGVAPSTGSKWRYNLYGTWYDAAGFCARFALSDQVNNFKSMTSWSVASSAESMVDSGMQVHCVLNGSDALGHTATDEGGTGGSLIETLCGDGSNPGLDGNCASGTWVPKSQAEAVKQLAAQGVTAATAGVGQAAVDAVNKGGITIPADSVKVTGPATQTLPAVVTQTTSQTDAQGNTKTATTTSQQTYTYSYDGPTVTVTTSTTTKTDNGDGTSTTVVSTPAKSPSTSTSPGSDPDNPGLCDMYPGIIACLKLGDAPTDKAPTGNVNVPSYVAESVDLPVGCPDDVIVAGKTVSYGPICTTATQARPWILVGAAFSALMLVLVAVRSI